MPSSWFETSDGVNWAGFKVFTTGKVGEFLDGGEVHKQRFFIPMNEMHLYFTFTHLNTGYCKFSLTYKHFISHKKVLFEPFHQLEWMNEWIIAPKKNQTRPNKMKIQFFFRNCWS